MLLLFFGLGGSAYKILVRKLQGESPCGRGGMAGKIILRWTSGTQCIDMDWMD
jgi:hypothetical protein